MVAGGMMGRLPLFPNTESCLRLISAVAMETSLKTGKPVRVT